MNVRYKIVAFFVLLFSSCKEEFTPSTIAGKRDLMVIEGYIDTSGDTTVIKLSRTADLQDKFSNTPEAGAYVLITGEDGSSVSAKSDAQGICSLLVGNLNSMQKYRLNVKTGTGKEYQTDFLENKQTPEIDTIGYKIKDIGLQIFVNTNDPSSQTKYYNWTYEETWEVIPPYQTTLGYVDERVIDKREHFYPKRCWQSSTSTEIVLGTSAALSESKLMEEPITYVKGNSEKIDALYSIKIRQFGITKEGYEYLKKMKQNTEQIGTIFDPQPSELKGNIYCTSNPKESVIGFMSSGRVTEKRVFIHRSVKPHGIEWNPPPCIKVLEFANYLNYNYLPVEYALYDNKIRLFVIYATCLDCTILGSPNKPAFWPN